MDNLRNHDFSLTMEMRPTFKEYRLKIFEWTLRCVPKYLELTYNTLEHSFRLFDIYVSSAKRTYCNLYSAFHDYLACLFISQKFIELYPRKLELFVRASQNNFSRQALKERELEILVVVDFKLVISLPSEWYAHLYGLKEMPKWAYECIAHL